MVARGFVDGGIGKIDARDAGPSRKHKGIDAAAAVNGRFRPEDGDEIVAEARLNGVCPAAAVDRIRAGAANDGVRAVRARQRDSD